MNTACFWNNALIYFSGNVYNTKDVYNAISKVKRTIADAGALEKYLANIQLDGGMVKWSKNAEEEVSVLWVQTQSMRSDMDKTKPWVWQMDATFSTNRLLYFTSLFLCLEDPYS